MLSDDGYEFPDQTEVVRRTRLKMPQDSVTRMRAMIRHELSLEAARQGFETAEEADDFEIEDEEPISPYEHNFDPPPPPEDSGGVADKTPAPTAGEPKAAESPPTENEA